MQNQPQFRRKEAFAYSKAMVITMHYLDYNEKKQHGTADFPIAFYLVNEYDPQYNMPFHWHIEHEIIRIVEGVLHLTLGDGEITAKAGDIVFINDGVIHGGIPENCIYECIVFDVKRLLMHTDACKQYIRRITRHEIIIKKLFTKENRPLLKAIDRLFNAMKKKLPANELVALGSLYETFGLIYQQELFDIADREPPTSAKKMAQLKPVLEFIESGYADPITLEELSKIAGMSSKYFCRHFHSVFHRTPMDYLNYYRIERACFEFSNTDRSVTDVAYHCGFNDTSYFIKTFKKYKSVTPKQYSLKIS